MHLVDHGTIQGNAGLPVALPIELRVYDHRFRHAPRIVPEILRQILFLIADDITEHFIRPAHFSGDSFGVGVEQEFRTVKPQAVFGIVRTGNAETVQLSRTRIGQKHVPDLIGTFTNRDANVLFGGLPILKQAKLNARGVVGK